MAEEGALIRPSMTVDLSSTTRSSICFSNTATPGRAILPGDDGFDRALDRYSDKAEAVALEKIIALKALARKVSDDLFWPLISQGLAEIFGAQFVTITKRLLRDESGKTIPPLGDPGSLCCTVACYHDVPGNRGFSRDVIFRGHDCPSAFMRHNRVFVAQKGLGQFIPGNPNASFLPTPMEACIGIPLLPMGHFCVIWSAEGAARRQLRWSFIESLCHCCEDLLADKLQLLLDKDRDHLPPHPTVDEDELPIAKAPDDDRRVHTLSHELRTPMQGVIGMLELVQSSIKDAAKDPSLGKAQQLFASLAADIASIDDSSRRAVEAAENVVAAYEMNILTKTSSRSEAEASAAPLLSSRSNSTVRLLVPSGEMRPKKRRREDEEDTPLSSQRVKKARMLDKPLVSFAEQRLDLRRALEESQHLTTTTQGADSQEKRSETSIATGEPVEYTTNNTSSGLRYCRIRHLLEYVINESLRLAKKPDTAVGHSTHLGQIVDVAYHDRDDVKHDLVIEWIVEATVPDMMLIHERNLAKLISCVFQNALKFTEDGRVFVKVQYNPETSSITIDVRDTGRGIHPSFQSQIFRPFSKEDNSITRQTEGLGLGLVVAKGLAAKLGGDLNLISASVEGPDRGSHFRIQVIVVSTEFNTADSLSSRDPSVIENFLDQISSTAPASPPNQAGTPVLSPTELEDTPAPSRRDSLQHALSTPAPAVADSVSPSKSLESTTVASQHPLTIMVVEDNDINRRMLVNMLKKLGYDPKTQIHEAHDGADAVRQATNLHRAKDQIDVILMDLWMPIMSGYEAAERILGLYQSVRQGIRRSVSEPVPLPPQAKAVIARGISPALSERPSAPLEAKSSNENGVEATSKPTSTAASTLKPSEDGTPSVVVQSEQASEPSAPLPTPAYMLPPTILAVTADVTDTAAEKAAKVGMEGFMAKPFKMKDLEKLVKEGWARRMGRLSGVGVGA